MCRPNDEDRTFQLHHRCSIIVCLFLIARKAVEWFHHVRYISLEYIDYPNTMEWLFAFSSANELGGAVMIGKINGGVVCYSLRGICSSRINELILLSARECFILDFCHGSVVC